MQSTVELSVSRIVFANPGLNYSNLGLSYSNPGLSYAQLEMSSSIPVLLTAPRIRIQGWELQNLRFLGFNKFF